MSSTFAERFHRMGRPLLWREHGETVRYYEGDGSKRDLTVIWSRTDPDADNRDGLGVTTYYATATAVVRVADLPDPHGSAEIDRQGERWSIRLVELQDEWTWILHVAQPTSESLLTDSLR